LAKYIITSVLYVYEKESASKLVKIDKHRLCEGGLATTLEC
jgi:hypothetical protein